MVKYSCTWDGLALRCVALGYDLHFSDANSAAWKESCSRLKPETKWTVQWSCWRSWRQGGNFPKFSQKKILSKAIKSWRKGGNSSFKSQNNQMTSWGKFTSFSFLLHNLQLSLPHLDKVCCQLYIDKFLQVKKLDSLKANTSQSWSQYPPNIKAFYMAVPHQCTAVLGHHCSELINPTNSLVFTQPNAKITLDFHFIQYQCNWNNLDNSCN